MSAKKSKRPRGSRLRRTTALPHNRSGGTTKQQRSSAMLYSETTHSGPVSSRPAIGRKASPGIKPDPIFAAIEAHKRAWAEFERAVDVEQALDEKLSADIKRRPQVKIGRLFLESPEAIDAAVREYCRGVEALFGRRPKKARQFYESERKRLHREFEADARMLKRLQDKHGWTAMRASYDAAYNAATSALTKMVNTKPTTAAGIAALATYAAEIYKEQLEVSDTDSARKVLIIIATAAERMAARH